MVNHIVSGDKHQDLFLIPRQINFYALQHRLKPQLPFDERSVFPAPQRSRSLLQLSNDIKHAGYVLFYLSAQLPEGSGHNPALLLFLLAYRLTCLQASFYRLKDDSIILRQKKIRAPAWFKEWFTPIPVLINFILIAV